MLREACRLGGVDNPLILRYEAVDALYFGCVPCDSNQEPEALSVEPKSG